MGELSKTVRELEEKFETTETKLLATAPALEQANKSFEESDRLVVSLWGPLGFLGGF